MKNTVGFHDKESDFLAFVNLWNYLGLASSKRCLLASSPSVSRGFPQLPARARVAGYLHPTAPEVVKGTKRYSG